MSILRINEEGRKGGKKEEGEKEERRGVSREGNRGREREGRKPDTLKESIIT